MAAITAIRLFLGGTAGVSGSLLAAFLAVEGTRPSGSGVIPTLVVVFVLSGLLWLVLWRKSRMKGRAVAEENPPKDPAINVTHNTVGRDLNVTGAVHVHAPRPGVRAQELFRNEPEGEGYHTRVAVQVDSAYAVHGLYIKAEAPSVERMALLKRGGAMTLGRERLTPIPEEPGVVFSTIKHPDPEYLVDVYTGQPEDVVVTCLPNAEHPTPIRAGENLGGIAF